jgi:hypothetical protein
VRARWKWTAGGAVAATAVLLWPGPAVSADTSLGGYQAVAEASVVHIEVYEPTIPIPATPQGDFSIGYAKSNVDTGPTTRALASYLWPGVVIGDGFDQLLKKPGAMYPVQVNSRFPATTTSPPKNTAQLTQGNGMTTSTDGFDTKATVTGLGVAGENTDLLTGIGQGLTQLGGKPPNKGEDVPVPIAASLAALVSLKNITADSTTTVADKTVTADAHAAVSDLSLLGGLIKLSGVDVESIVTSDGNKATTSGDATIGGLKIAGLNVPISNKGTGTLLPGLGQTLTSLLSGLGISIAVVPVTQQVSGAQGTMTAQTLQVSIDTHPLKAVLDNVLNPLYAKLPAYARQNLDPIIQLAPKIVITIGNSNATATASPAFNDNFPVSSGGGAIGGSGAGGTGTGGGNTTPLTPPLQSNPGPGSVSQTPPNATTAAHVLPGLGEVPRWLIFGAILLAALIGWAITSSAGFLFGAAGRCGFGLATGVPDLRKG